MSRGPRWHYAYCLAPRTQEIFEDWNFASRHFKFLFMANSQIRYVGGIFGSPRRAGIQSLRENSSLIFVVPAFRRACA